MTHFGRLFCALTPAKNARHRRLSWIHLRSSGRLSGHGLATLQLSPGRCSVHLPLRDRRKVATSIIRMNIRHTGMGRKLTADIPEIATHVVVINAAARDAVASLPPITVVT